MVQWRMLWAGKRSLRTNLGSAKFHEDMGFVSLGHWWIPSAWLIFTAQLNIWEWTALSLRVIIFCLLTCLSPVSPPGGSSMGEGPLSVYFTSVLYPNGQQGPWHHEDTNTYLPNEVMDKLIVWSPASFRESWFSHGKRGMDRSWQFLNSKYK